MPKKSPVAGISGAVRVQRLSAVSFAAAEAHGKRLDAIGKARAVIPNAPPLTTSGLDLDDLYRAHVDGLQVQKSNTKALHLVLQFPTGLIDGEDAETMLKHSRDFVASIFGDGAVFADRVDRDEKSRHVVDLFIAPKYEKQTKRQSKAAISTSKHLKDLAASRGKAPNLRGQGQALQDAWFEYLRDRAGLAVYRGSMKKQAGDDWLTPEQLAQERLSDENARLAVENARLKAEIDAEAATLLQVKDKTLEAMGEAIAQLDSLEAKKRAAEAALGPLQDALAPLEAAVAQMDAFRAASVAYEAAYKEAEAIYQITEVEIYNEEKAYITAVNLRSEERSYWATHARTPQSPGIQVKNLLDTAKAAGKELWMKVKGWIVSSVDNRPVPERADPVDPPSLPPKPTLAPEVVRVLSMLDAETMSAVRQVQRAKAPEFRM